MCTALSCGRGVYQRQCYCKAPCLRLMTCLLWALKPVSLVMLFTRSLFYRGNRRKTILWKFLRGNSDTSTSVPSKPQVTNHPSEHSGNILWRPIQHHFDGMLSAPSPHSKPHFKNERKDGHDARNELAFCITFVIADASFSLGNNFLLGG